MRYYKTDETLFGIFSCIFNIIMSDEINYELYSPSTHITLLDKIEEVKTSETKANKVKKDIIKFAGEGVLHDIIYAYRSGEHNKNSIILRFVIRLLNQKNNISKDSLSPEVLSFYDLIKRIGLEIRKNKSSIVFERSKNGIFYACISPYHNIADLLLPYFERQTPNFSIAIHDTYRNIIALSDGSKRKILKISHSSATNNLTENQLLSIWKKYYSVDNIVNFATVDKTHNLSSFFQYSKNELILKYKII